MKYQNIAFLFPGQGAQVVGMGKDFESTFQEAKEVFQEGNDILGKDLSKIIFEGPTETLIETCHSQTGIFVNSMAILKVIQKQFPNLVPTVCAGLSLGEYTALTAAQKISFQECLPLVHYRGEWMSRACVAYPGTMAAIMGLSNESVEEIVARQTDLWVANYNCPGQIVISGSLKGVEAGILAAKERGAKRALPLQVHGAFHSGFMTLAKEKLKEKIDALKLNESSIGIVMNVVGDFVQEKERIRNLLIEQVTSAVRWEQGIRAMQDKVDLFIEIGCGKVLSGLNRQIGVLAPTINVNKVGDLEELAKVC